MLYHAVGESVRKIGVLIIRNMKGKVKYIVANSNFIPELEDATVFSLFRIF
jgi:hypothetical protein